jgi:hypothetical protein
MDQFSVVEQIIELSAIDFVERYVQAEVLIALQEVADVEGGKKIETRI